MPDLEPAVGWGVKSCREWEGCSLGVGVNSCREWEGAHSGGEG